MLCQSRALNRALHHQDDRASKQPQNPLLPAVLYRWEATLGKCINNGTCWTICGYSWSSWSTEENHWIPDPFDSGALSAGERAELDTEEYFGLAASLEDIVILQKNPEYVEVDLEAIANDNAMEIDEAKQPAASASAS